MGLGGDGGEGRMANIPRQAARLLQGCENFAILITRWQEGSREYPPDNYERVMAVLDRLAVNTARFMEEIQKDVRAFIPLEDGWEYIEAIAAEHPYYDRLVAKHILWGERDDR